LSPTVKSEVIVTSFGNPTNIVPPAPAVSVTCISLDVPLIVMLLSVPELASNSTLAVFAAPAPTFN